MATPKRKSRLTDEENFRSDAERQVRGRMDEVHPNSITEIIIDDTEELEETSKEEDLRPSRYQVHSTGKVTKMAGGMIDPSEWNLGDIPEPEVLSDGDEVQVTIISVIKGETKTNSSPYWRVTLEVPDRPLVKDFPHFLYEPNDTQTAKQAYNSKYNIQTFMKAFKLDMSRPFDPESDWIGETAWCIVGMREDPEYGKQNFVRKWILPR